MKKLALTAASAPYRAARTEVFSTLATSGPVTARSSPFARRGSMVSRLTRHGPRGVVRISSGSAGSVPRTIVVSVTPGAIVRTVRLSERSLSPSGREAVGRAAAGWAPSTSASATEPRQVRKVRPRVLFMTDSHLILVAADGVADDAQPKTR